MTIPLPLNVKLRYYVGFTDPGDEAILICLLGASDHKIVKESQKNNNNKNTWFNDCIFALGRRFKRRFAAPLTDMAFATLIF